MIGSLGRNNRAWIPTFRLDDWEISTALLHVTNERVKNSCNGKGFLPPFSTHRFDEDNSHQHTFACEANRGCIDDAA